MDITIRIMCAVCLGVGVLAAVETPTYLDVLTLKDGRILEGTYDPVAGTLTTSGKIKGVVTIDPANIVRHQTRKAGAEDKAAASSPPVDPEKGAAAVRNGLQFELK